MKYMSKTKKLRLQLDQLTNYGMLESMYLDRVMFRFIYKDYPNKVYMNEERIWRNWLCNISI